MVPNSSGIYTITNIVNGKIYVGLSVQMSTRASQHLYELRRNVHSNSYLQNAYNTVGETNLIIEVLELCDPEMLHGLENFWVNMLSTYDRNYGYNLQPTGTGTCRVHSQETRNKLSKINTGRLASEVTKARISAALKGRPGPRKGQPVSEESRKKMSDAHKGKGRAKGHIPSAETRAIWSAQRKGRICTEETRRKLGIKSAIAKSKRVSGVNMITGGIVYFSSAKQAGLIIGGDAKRGANIAAACTGKQPTAYGYIWRYT